MLFVHSQEIELELSWIVPGSSAFAWCALLIPARERATSTTPTSPTGGLLGSFLSALNTRPRTIPSGHASTDRSPTLPLDSWSLATDHWGEWLNESTSTQTGSREDMVSSSPNPRLLPRLRSSVALIARTRKAPASVMALMSLSFNVIHSPCFQCMS